MRRDPVMIEFEQEQQCKAPMYCNKYAVDDEMAEKRPDRRQPNMRSQSMPRQMQSRFGDRLMPPHQGSIRRENSAQPYDENDTDMPLRKGRKQTRPGKFFRSFAVVAFSVICSKTFKANRKDFLFLSRPISSFKNPLPKNLIEKGQKKFSVKKLFKEHIRKFFERTTLKSHRR